MAKKSLQWNVKNGSDYNQYLEINKIFALINQWEVDTPLIISNQTKTRFNLTA